MATNSKYKKFYSEWKSKVEQSNKTEASRSFIKLFGIDNHKTITKGFERVAKKQGETTAPKQVTKEEAELIDGIREHAAEHNIGIKHIKHLWAKNKGSSIFVKNPLFVNADEGFSFNDIDKRIKKLALDVKFPKLKRQKFKDPNILVIDPADIHVGKLASLFETGDEYNSQIAVDRVKEGVTTLLERSRPYNIEKIVLITGNDILHVDNTRSTTTSGTNQDTDSMWYDAFNKAIDCFVKVITMMLPLADVHVVYNPSNHDYQAGFYFAQVLKAYFHNSPNISFDASMSHRKYFHYGVNLIGSSHGDGAKVQDLPDLMKTEARKAWAKSKYGYWYLHHIHHKDRRKSKGKKGFTIEKDYGDVTVIGDSSNLEEKDYTHIEYLRSASGTDGWHHRNGYQHSPKAIESFLHSYYLGQIGRFTHFF